MPRRYLQALTGTAALIAYGVDTVGCKVATKMLVQQRVAFALRRHGQQGTQPGQIKDAVDLCRQGITAQGAQSLHPCLADRLPMGVDHQQRHFQLLQHLTQCPSYRIGTDHEYPATLRLGNPEQARNGSRSRALKHHRADNHGKGQRTDQRRILITGLLQTQGKQCRDRRSDNPARADPGNQRPLSPIKLAAQAAYPDRQRPCNELDHQQQGQRRQAQGKQCIQIQSRRQQDKQPGNQQHRQMLLEHQDLFDIHTASIGQPDTHHRHSQQTGFMGQLVGQSEGHQHQSQRGQHLKVFGNPAPTHGGRHQRTTSHPGDRAVAHYLEEDQRTGQQAAVTRALGSNPFVDQYRQQRTDRINQDAFPTQHTRDSLGCTQGTQHRHNHRGPGYHHKRTEQRRQTGIQANQPVAGNTDNPPGHQRTQSNQPAHHGTGFLELFELQRQAAFKQDQGDTQRHQRKQQLTKEVIWRQ